MARLLPILLVLGLLGGTAAAFAITEGLKLEKSPIAKTQITKLFSPTCDCATGAAAVSFRLRHGDVMTVRVIDADGNAVDTLADHYFRRGNVGPLKWSGRDSGGAGVPDGPYKLELHLKNRHQTITLPNTIVVKTAPALIRITHVQPRVFSPDHDGHAEYVTVSYSVTGSARPLLYVDGRQVGRGRLTRSTGKLNWYGGSHGEKYPPGLYKLSLRAQDRAGNISPPTRDVTVRLRYLTLNRHVVHVRRGKRFKLGVSTDADTVHWRLNGKIGESSDGSVLLVAPKKPGRYRVYVTSVGHSAVALVVVEKK